MKKSDSYEQFIETKNCFYELHLHEQCWGKVISKRENILANYVCEGHLNGSGDNYKLEFPPYEPIEIRTTIHCLHYLTEGINLYKCHGEVKKYKNGEKEQYFCENHFKKSGYFKQWAEISQ